MTNNKYAKAYKEVLEIIQYFPEKEYKKIPKEKIDFYKNNMDNEYEFAIDPGKDLSEQNISKEANTIIVSLYQDYFATEEQKQKIKEILELNEKKAEQKKGKYDPNNIFKDKTNIKNIEQPNVQKTSFLVEYKENFFTRFKKFILKLLHIWGSVSKSRNITLHKIKVLCKEV